MSQFLLRIGRLRSGEPQPVSDWTRGSLEECLEDLFTFRDGNSWRIELIWKQDPEDTLGKVLQP